MRSEALVCGAHGPPWAPSTVGESVVLVPPLCFSFPCPHTRARELLVHTQAHTHMLTQTYAHTHACTRTRTYAHTRTHTSRRPALSWTREAGERPLGRRVRRRLRGQGRCGPRTGVSWASGCFAQTRSPLCCFSPVEELCLRRDGCHRPGGSRGVLTSLTPSWHGQQRPRRLCCGTGLGVLCPPRWETGEDGPRKPHASRRQGGGEAGEQVRRR